MANPLINSGDAVLVVYFFRFAKVDVAYVNLYKMEV